MEDLRLMVSVNVTPPEIWWFSFLPLIVVGAVILGLIFLIVIGILVSRRVTVTMRASGAVALTLASILLLSGLWCMFLSPTIAYSETRGSFYSPISIDGFKSWSYTFSVYKGDILSGSVDGIKRFDGFNATGKAFNLRIYDSDNIVIWSQPNVTNTYFSIEALKSGMYKVEVQNPNEQAVEINVQVSVTAKVTYRPLEPVGQWLSLISLPIFGLGMWASGVFAAAQRKEKRETVNTNVQQ